jgi:hypothetical protein
VNKEELKQRVRDILGEARGEYRCAADYLVKTSMEAKQKYRNFFYFTDGTADDVVPTPTPTRKKLVEVTVDGRKFMRLE